MIRKCIFGFSALIIAITVLSTGALAGGACVTLPSVDASIINNEIVVQPMASPWIKVMTLEQAEPPKYNVEPIPSANRIAMAATDISALVSKFEVKASTYYDKQGFSSNHYAYTSKDVKMLAIVIHMEARNQPYNCMVAVGNVVMNRVLASGYPGDTIAAVVTRKNQFCYRASVKPAAICMKAALDVLKYELWTVPQNTYFFKASRSSANWGRHPFYARIGTTAFYRDSKYAGRNNGSAIPASLYERVYRWPQYGCKPGSRVYKLQRMLYSFGYKVKADGYFGTDTKVALVKFQKSKNLKADGIAGPATLRAMIRKYGIRKFMKL